MHPETGAFLKSYGLDGVIDKSSRKILSMEDT